jgi:hypothetical protein
MLLAMKPGGWNGSLATAQQQGSADSVSIGCSASTASMLLGKLEEAVSCWVGTADAYLLLLQMLPTTG